MELLKLVALDRDDLEVVSTHLQDAVVCVGDVYWRPTEKRLVISLARFDWEGSVGPSHEFQRRRTALRFDRVISVKCRNVDCTNKQAILNLLAVEFEEQNSPAGVVTLTFSGGAALRLDGAADGRAQFSSMCAGQGNRSWKSRFGPNIGVE